MKSLLAVMSIGLCACASDEPRDEAASPAIQESEVVGAEMVTSFYQPGIATPFDILYYEPGDDVAAEHYLASLNMRTTREGEISLTSARTQGIVRRYLVDTERGFVDPIRPGENALDDFVYDNYTKWCGKVHNGRKIKWQLCSGADCGSGGGLCIKACVKVAGTCIP